MGSPYAHMSTPKGGAHTGPQRGPVTLLYTNPEGVCVPDPKGVRLRYFTQTPSGFVYRTPKGSGITTPYWGVVITKPLRGFVTLRYRTPSGSGTNPLWGLVSGIIFF